MSISRPISSSVRLLVTCGVLLGGYLSASAADLKGTIVVDGSSTVFPITKVVAEKFREKHKDVKIQIAVSGTGGGFKKFVVGEIDINDASRPISEKEIAECKKNSIEYVKLTIAIDGLSVIVSKKNKFCTQLTVEQLKKLWSPDSKVKTWKDLDPKWPDQAIRLYGADADSGTFDYFTEVIVGTAKSSRTDYTKSSDDNLLVKGVAEDQYALGYLGYAYYVENADTVKAVAIAPAGGKGKFVKPLPETIEDGSYTPLSRPLFLYVSKKALARPAVAAFLKYYLVEGQDLVSDVGFVEVDEKVKKESLKALEGK